MKLFDPHVHMNARTTDDYQNMAKAGIVAVCEPAFWVGEPRTSAGSYHDYLKTLIGWERFRASQFGIKHFCAVSLNPREANSDFACEAIELIPDFLHKEDVIAIGEIGFDDMTKEEEYYFAVQLNMAKEYNMPVIIHTPHRNKKRGTQKSIDFIKKAGIKEEMVNIDHNTEETLPLVLEQTNCWAGHTIYPKTKMSKQRMITLIEKYGTDRIIINSSADWGISDPLNVAKTYQLMKEHGFGEEKLHTLFWNNPVNFFKQGPNFDVKKLDQLSIDQTQIWEGNTVLRGQAPVIEKEIGS